MAQWFEKKFLEFVNVFLLFCNLGPFIWTNFRYLVIISPWKRMETFICTNLISFTQGYIVLSLFEIGALVLEKKDFQISLLSLLGKGWGLLFGQTWIPFTQGCFVPGLVETGPVVLEKKMYFHYFIIISLWKRVRPFVWTNFNPLHPTMLYAKFGWNWPCGSGEENENVKSLQTDRWMDRQKDRWSDRQTMDNRRSEKLPWAFSSDELIMDNLMLKNIIE